MWEQFMWETLVEEAEVELACDNGWPRSKEPSAALQTHLCNS